MNDHLYRTTMLTGMASVIRLIQADQHHAEPAISARALHDSCTKLCEAMENMAREEEASSQMRRNNLAQAVHAAYTYVLPPDVMLSEAEKTRAFDRLRAALYPNGHDPFGISNIT